MTNLFTFEEATKDQAKARIALDGPSGSGKTWTALTLATAFGGEFAVIDTERGSASKYVGPFTFKRLNLTRYDPADIPQIFATAAAQGFETVVIDSLSKFWGGTGGMLDRVDNSAKRKGGGNQFAGWKEERPVEAAMIEAMLGYPGHVIVTMRVKTAYDVTTDDRGKKVPVKIGLTPEQRAGIEYEFDIVGDMDLDNTLTISKTRCPALSQAVIRRPGAEVAETILEWLSDGRPVLDATAYRDLALAEPQDPLRLRELWSDVRARGLLGAAVIDEHGDSVTLGELVARKGKEAVPVRPVTEMPRNTDGTVSRSRTTDAEKDAAGVMTEAQQKEHTALGGGEHKTPKADRGKVTRSRPTASANGARTPARDGSAPATAAPDDPWADELAVPPENRPGTISPDKMRRVQALFSRWFTDDERDERIKAAARIVGRPLTGPLNGESFSNLTLAEADMLLGDEWAKVKTRDDLVAKLAGAVAT